MPSLRKKAISLYFRTGCLRQLVLNLYGDEERRERGMPPRQEVRRGLGLVGRAGYKWQDEKIAELDLVFGKNSVRQNPNKKGSRPGTLVLRDILPDVDANQFIVEARYNAETQRFKNAVRVDELSDLEGDPLAVGDAYPDLIQVLPSMEDRPTWDCDSEGTVPAALGEEVLPNGDLQALEAHDSRLRLRVIDIKQSAEPGAHYFAEVVYYSITLASWIAEHGWDDRFVVAAAPAVWPGSYEASAIMLIRERCRKEGREPLIEELTLALEEDIEVSPFDVFAPRLRRFFSVEVPYVLQTPWHELPWHVSFFCKGCEFLGYPWLGEDRKPLNDPQHCWPMAEQTDHLSRVAGLTKGGAALLSSAAPDVSSLALLPVDDTAFTVSPTLRSKRTVYPHRALSLQDTQTRIVPDSGSDALMPRWPDLHIYLFLDYDLASAVTVAFGLRGFWREPLPYKSSLDAQKLRWSGYDSGKPTNFQEVFLVGHGASDLVREREELLKFLRALRFILDTVIQQDKQDVDSGRRLYAANRQRTSTYQIYLWDEGQRRHLVRVIGRHLGAILNDKKLRDLAWLFPPPELLIHPEEASYNSPFTLVSNAIQSAIAVPVPHHYTLLEVAEFYKPASYKSPSVHPLFREPLSDLVPGERIHEMWEQIGDWLRTASTIEETVRRKLLALSYVVSQAERDLKDVLSRSAAPPLLRNSDRLRGVPPQSELWYQFTRLNAALTELEAHSVRAMPAYEREARFKSAFLLERLEGRDRAEALDSLADAAEQPLRQADELLVYRLSPDSREFNVRAPAIGYALAPRSEPAFLNKAAFPLIQDSGLDQRGSLKGSVAECQLTEVSIEAVDRIGGYIALKTGYRNRVFELEEAEAVDFRTDIMLDPVSRDYLSSKIRITLRGIGRPASARDDKRTLRALGIEKTDRSPCVADSPASEFLWEAARLAERSLCRDLSDARSLLEDTDVGLNPSQWMAWETSLDRRVALIWGPPGTGKSLTLRAILAGAALHACINKEPVRMLIAAHTYRAVDNVLLKASELLANLLPEGSFQVFRLQSQYKPHPTELTRYPEITPVAVRSTYAKGDVIGLQELLDSNRSIVLVGGPSQQIHNLALATKNKTKRNSPRFTQRRWFDLVAIDEASQLDIAESTLIVSKAAEEAIFVLAGDDKQLPPIQQAIPPQDLDHVVGSVYSYVRHHHEVAPCPLQVNYRSNRTLIGFTKNVGYDPGLKAHHSDLQLALLEHRMPSEEQPSDWPRQLYWSSGWNNFLDPRNAAVCYIYDDELSGQANDFEADAVAALLWLLFGCLDRQLSGELDRDGNVKPVSGETHSEASFWESAVGVVTPHRAQMGKIVARLHQVFPDHDPASIWNAVDTVERFQGQQRDTIIASFGLGDPDLIRTEESFIYNLNRFNVMASRARAKLIVLTTRSLVDHLASDIEVLEDSRLLKTFAESFCKPFRSLDLGYYKDGILHQKKGQLRKH